MTRTGLLILLILCLPWLGGCGSLLVGPALEPLAANLGRQTDPELVCEGVPSFLLALDSLLVAQPTDRRLLLHATQAFTAYAGLAPECDRSTRVAALSSRAKDLGLRLLALELGLPDLAGLPADQLDPALMRQSKEAAQPLFWGAYGWAGWVAASQGAAAAMADLPKIEKLMLRVIELDESTYYGGAHLFLGVFHGSRPALLGGQPERSKAHFERALALNGRLFLPALLAYAEYYARPTFNRELYQSLLAEVLAFDPTRAPETTLANLVAKRRAQKLLDQIEDYF